MQSGVWQKFRNKGVVVVGVNCGERGQDPFGKARAFRDKHRLTYPIAVDADDEVRRMFGVNAFPTNVIIDKNNVIRYAQAGFDPQGILNTLGQLSGGG